MGVVVLDNFRQGEYGTLGPRNPPPGTYHGENVLVFADGSVGPRGGFAKVLSTPTGSASQPPRLWAPTKFSYDNLTKPRIAAVGVSGGAVWNKAYDIDLDVGGFTKTDYAGTTALGTGYMMPWVRSTTLSVGAPRIIAGLPGDKMYTIDPVTRTLTGLAGTPAAGAMTMHGSRLLVSTSDQYLWYSDPNALGSFGGGLNFIPIGPDYNPVCALFTVKDRVFIAKTDGTWWMLTGTPGVNESLRRVYDGLGVRFWHEGIVTKGGDLWFCPARGDYPVQFNGAAVTELKHLSAFDPITHIQPYASTDNIGSWWSTLAGADDVMLLVGSTIGSGDPKIRMLLRRNGAWTLHSLAQSTFGLMWNSGRPYVAAQAFDNSGIVAMWAGETTSGGSGSGVFVADFELDRPGWNETSGRTFKTGDYLDNGLAFPTLFEPPQQWGNDEVLVHRVVVEYTRYDLGVAGNVGFDLNVRAYGHRGAYGPATSVTQSVSVAQGSAQGTKDWAELYFGDQGPGVAWQLSFSNLKGVAINSILVETQ